MFRREGGEAEALAAHVTRAGDWVWTPMVESPGPEARERR